MRQLRTCDFCGGEAVGTFEIVPTELNPSEAEQRRIVLCESCQPTLEELLEPLLARAGAGEAAHPDTAETADTDEQVYADRTDEAPESAEAAPTERESTSGPISDDADETIAPNAGSARDRGRVDGDTTATRGTPGIETGPDDESPDAVITPDRTDRSAVDDEGVAIQPGRTESGHDDQTAESASSPTGDDSTTAGATPDDASQTSGAPQAPAPRAYGNVLRLLQNREFPMARADVEELAAGAYDLEGHEVEAVVDHAIERGELVEDGRNIHLG